MKTKRIIVLMLVLSIVMSVFSIIPASASSGVSITSPDYGDIINNTKYEIRFTWDSDISSAYAYKITLQTTSSDDYDYSTMVLGNYYNVPSQVLPAGKYKFKVVAIDSHGNNLASDYIKFRITR